ncbi:MAG: carboxylesterase family protein [Halioglobus sp.]|nr:carboxylesterase family protein [Halioglobus sp.]
MSKGIAILAVVAAAVLVAYLWLSPAGDPVVRTADPLTQRATSAGPVVGAVDADNTFAWLGIPFAAPPVGELRWRAPQAVTPWEAVRETVAFREPCVQLPGPLDGLPDDSGAVVGSEDCLYLNIWTPRAHSSPDAGKLPVMFWIHGGGNTIGTANTYPGNKLAAGEQVVVVTINYRLGFFGWMSHPALRGKGRDALDASGNYANLDMIAALQWVQDNIANFGGDPDNVTIFGESAGGRNVYGLMASPLARGLFHRAIAQSGSVGTTPRWRAENFRDQPNPGMALSSREWLSLQLQNAGRATDSDAARAAQLLMSNADVRTFMYSRSAEQVLEGVSGSAGMYAAPQSFRDGTVLPRETLYRVFSDPQRYNSVPLITGSNRDEMKLFLAQSPAFVERKLGFIPQIRDPQAYHSLAAYLSDNWKALAVDTTADIIAANSTQPVFAYRWDWDEGGNNLLVDYSELLGAAHGLEVAYIFNDFDQGISVPGLYNSDNIPGRDLLGAQMRSYWSEFARNGAPGRGRSGALPLWRPWSSPGPNLMVLDTAADGGPHMVREPMTVAMLKQRVAEDPDIPDLRTRCALYVQLFLLANSGADVWNRKEYNALGCAGFNPWSLEIPR